VSKQHVTWMPASNPPMSLIPVLIWGKLDIDRAPFVHEGFWTGKKWESVRINLEDSDRRHEIHNVTHWAHMPNPPEKP